MQGEIVSAPALAEVQRRVVERAPWLRHEALAIDRDLWRDAREEHKQILEARGWALAVDNEMAKRGRQHFLLLGIPIVMDEA